MDDLSTSVEIRLGELVKEKYGVDFYILDQYPASKYHTHGKIVFISFIAK
jgi:aspartyl-tRNA synthetase